MMTETGRFQTNARICLSISDYHPESWNPVWPVSSVIVGLISFFTTEDNTVGSISTSHAERERIAKASKEKIKNHPVFKSHFKDFAHNIGLAEAPPQAPS